MAAMELMQIRIIIPSRYPDMGSLLDLFGNVLAEKPGRSPEQR